MSVSGSNSEVLVGYTNEFPALKTDAPIGHPHIVDLNTIPDDMLEDERNVLKLRFADGIATLLFKVNPVALTAFLNMCNEYFSFWIIEPKSATEGHMFIFRKGSEVTVSSLHSTPHTRLCAHADGFNELGWLRSQVQRRVGRTLRVHNY